MRKFTVNFLAIITVSLIVLCGCETDKKPQEDPDVKVYDLNASPEKEATPAQTDDPYIISPDGFFGLKEGESIAKAGKKLLKGIMETGEADFDVYYILGPEGDTLGHIFPGMNDETMIGDIIITSPKGRTQDGIKVGTTFEALEKKLGEMEVHGSEIEGWTSAQKGNYRYGLDIGFWSYEVDKTKIKPGTKVTEISIFGDVGE